jgi:hypothetical protein
LLAVGAIALLYGTLIWSLLRSVGGWRRLNRSRRHPGEDPWAGLATIQRSWVVALPIVLGVAAAALAAAPIVALLTC